MGMGFEGFFSSVEESCNIVCSKDYEIPGSDCYQKGNPGTVALLSVVTVYVKFWTYDNVVTNARQNAYLYQIIHIFQIIRLR